MNPRPKNKIRDAALRLGYADEFAFFSDLHYTQRYTQTQIAEKIGCSSSLICTKMQELGIPVRDRKCYSDISNEQVREMVEQMGSRAAVAEKLGVSKSLINAVMSNDRVEKTIEKKCKNKKRMRYCILCRRDRGVNRFYCPDCLARLSSEYESAARFEYVL